MCEMRNNGIRKLRQDEERKGNECKIEIENGMNIYHFNRNDFMPPVFALFCLSTRHEGSIFFKFVSYSRKWAGVSDKINRT